MNAHTRALAAEACGTFWFFFIGAGAILTDSVVVRAYPVPVIDRLTDGKLCAVLAAPVHESGEVTGGPFSHRSFCG